MSYFTDVRESSSSVGSSEESALAATGPPSAIVRDALALFAEEAGLSRVLAAIEVSRKRPEVAASMDGATTFPDLWWKAMKPFLGRRSDAQAMAITVATGDEDGERLLAVVVPEAQARGGALVAGLLESGREVPGALRPTTLIRLASIVVRAMYAERHQQRMDGAVRALGDHLQEALLIYIPGQGVCYANAASLLLFDVSKEAMLAFSDEDLRARVHPHDIVAVGEMYERMLGTPGVSHVIECRLRRGDEAWRWCLVRALRLAGQPGAGYVAFRIIDLTDRTVHRKFLEYEATHDSLTGLTNRATFDRQTAELLEADVPGALLIVDLNRFRLVNSIYGHATGDLVLRELGSRLLANRQDGDIISRYGGDEFLIFAPVADRAAAIQRAQRYLACLRDVFSVRGRAIALQASIGIARAPVDGVSLDHLYRAADRALYRVKAGKGERIAAFDQEMDGYFDHADRLARDFSGGIESGAIVLYFQPICDLRTGNIVACEGLLRWQHPLLGLLTPREILPVVVEHGFEDILAKHTLGLALDAVAALGLGVAVNLSPSQLHNHRLVPWIGNALAKRGIEPGHLTVEVTESEAITAPQTGMKILRAIRDLGIQVAIDDFGTGYSDLAAIQTYPADSLKIDRGFVSLLGGERDSGAIVRGIMAIAKDQALEVVAEGIETERQRERLRDMGCHLGQGFLFGRAVPLPELAATIARQRSAS